jgi:hypothetical protein
MTSLPDWWNRAKHNIEALEQKFGQYENPEGLKKICDVIYVSSLKM